MPEVAEIVLQDGTPHGLMVAKFANWTGVVISCPKDQLNSLKARVEDESGIYFLWGPDPDIEEATRTYVGEGDDIWIRISSHDKKKKFWNRVIAVKGNAKGVLTKSQIKYLEAKSFGEIKKIGLATTKQNEPKMQQLDEGEKINCDTFYDRMLQLLPILGYPFLSPINISNSTESDESVHTFEIESKIKKVKATAVQTGSKLVVLRGSTANKDVTPGLRTGRALRSKLIEDGVLINIGESFEFTRDYPFNSPTVACNVVLGNQNSGPQTWKEVKTGKTWKDVFSQDSD